MKPTRISAVVALSLTAGLSPFAQRAGPAQTHALSDEIAGITDLTWIARQDGSS